MKDITPNILYIIPTPLGNLEDITLRALNILKQVDLLVAEDTRVTSILLQHYSITKPMLSFHNFNEHRKVSDIIEKIKSGTKIGLVSDGGTPGISDPGFLLVRECLKHSIRVECIPGPTALIPALINSGLPCDRFVFEGFLPHKKGRQKRIIELSEEKRTMIFYESPMRLLKALTEFILYFGSDRPASVSRELTKFYEEVQNGTLNSLLKYYSTKEIKGEIVIIVKGKE